MRTHIALRLAALVLSVSGLGLSIASAADEGSARKVTFTRDVAPIVFEHCVTCHRPGEVAPFPLTSYKEVAKHASQIVDVTQNRYMPPWKPEPGYGEFVGCRRISDPQVRTIADWVSQGKIEGAAADLPALPKFAQGWQLGEPDLVVNMSEPYTLKAEGRDVFRVFVIPLNLTEDKYVTAVEFRPGNRKIVHHALFFLDTTGTARKLDAADPEPGYSQMGGVGFLPSGGLGGWAPGVTPNFLPNGVGRPVRKGSDLVVQVHFHPSGKIEKEQSTFGIYFAKKPPEKVLNSFMKASFPLNIDAGNAHYEVNDSFTVPAPVTLIGITPHAHLVCREIKVDATFPDGTEHPLIWIKDWNWDWQDQYMYKEPIQIPAGTKVRLHYVYDNSADNPKNPNNPPKRVRWGEQTADEMAITFFNFVADRGAGPMGLRARLRLRR